jgi:hypothetical protein
MQLFGGSTIIGQPQDGNDFELGTAGAIVRGQQHAYLITAAHVVGAPGRPVYAPPQEGVDFTLQQNRILIGNVVVNLEPPGGQNPRFDAAIVRLNGNVAPIEGQLSAVQWRGFMPASRSLNAWGDGADGGVMEMAGCWSGHHSVKQLTQVERGQLAQGNNVVAVLNNTSMMRINLQQGGNIDAVPVNVTSGHAPVHPGDSGGPVFVDNRLAGILVGDLVVAGTCFYTPISVIMPHVP